MKGWEVAQFIYNWLHKQDMGMDDLYIDKLSAVELLEKLEEDRQEGETMFSSNDFGKILGGLLQIAGLMLIAFIVGFGLGAWVF